MASRTVIYMIEVRFDDELVREEVIVRHGEFNKLLGYMSALFPSLRLTAMVPYLQN